MNQPEGIIQSGGSAYWTVGRFPQVSRFSSGFEWRIGVGILLIVVSGLTKIASKPFYKFRHFFPSLALPGDKFYFD